MQALLNVSAELVCAICSPRPCFPAMTDTLGRIHLCAELWDAALVWDHQLQAISERHCIQGWPGPLQKISFMRCQAVWAFCQLVPAPVCSVLASTC